MPRERNKLTPKELLVVGNMRCGTTWLTHALRHIGMDVMHECFGEDGSVSWFFTLDHHWYPAHPNNTPRGRTAHIGEGRRSDYQFDHVVHLVRDPLKTIGSMCSIMQKVEQEWLAEIGIVDMEAKPKLLRMMQAWDGINQKAEYSDMRISLEAMETKDWARLMKLLGRKDPYPDIPVKNASRGIFKAKQVTFQQMRDLDPKLTQAILKRARRYGYKY